MSLAGTSLITADEFAEFVELPENHGKFFELVRGEVIELPPPQKPHGFVCGNVAFYLSTFVRQRGDLYLCSNDTGVQVEEDPDTVRGPDISVFAGQIDLDEDYGYKGDPPLLCVDVVSPSDRVNQIAERVADLLNGGVRLVWVVDPAARDVSIHRPGAVARRLQGAAEITGEDVLPGFACKISDFFASSGMGRRG